MTWIIDTVMQHWELELSVGGGALVLGFLWWALADLVLATFDLTEPFERWARRLGLARKDPLGEPRALR